MHAAPGSFRAILLLVAVGAILAGCAARQPAPSPTAPTVQLPWKAAIGKLEVSGEEPCTAVLVAPNAILTASHCLHQAASATAPDAVRFLPNFGAEPELPVSQGTILRAQGGAIQEGHLRRPEQVAADWALVGISPPVTSVAPVPLARLELATIKAKIAGGAKLYTAGYGSGSMKALRQHSKCGIVDPPSQHPIFVSGMFITDCIIRVGDSGGPVILIDGAGKPLLIGIFAGFGLGNQLGLSYAANAGNAAPYLAPGLLSALPQVLLLNQRLVGQLPPLHERHRDGRD